jgi:hypothetical protein
MVPWVYRSLRARPAEEIPTEVREQLRSLTQQIAIRSLFLTGELLRVLSLMSAAGIRAVPFKGPLLGALSYGDASLRECDDIDVLVRPEEVRRTTELLQAHGYDFWKPTSNSDQERLFRTGCAFTFLHHKTQIHLDLHWRFTASGFSFPYSVEALWGRLKPVPVAGREVLSFPLEDVILLHCVHGAKHQWERLEWVNALSGLLRSHPNVDWNELLRHARQLRAERILLLGVRLASDFFGTALPNSVWFLTEKDPTLPSLVSQAQTRMASQEDAPIQEAQYHAFRFRVRESWRDRICYCIYLMRLKAAPTAKDHDAIHMPASLSGLYYLARPFRLVHTYGLTPLKRFFRLLRST